MLSGPRVRLRPFTEADFDERYRRHIDMSQRGDYYPLHLSSEATYRARFAENGWWSPNEGALAILDDQGNLAGTVDFERVVADVDELVIGYLVYPEYRGRGYASEALGLFVRYLFATRHDMNRARLNIHLDNAASIGVAERAGFKLEGRAREGWYHRGRWQDVLMYSLVRGELEAVKSQHVV